MTSRLTQRREPAGEEVDAFASAGGSISHTTPTRSLTAHRLSGRRISIRRPLFCLRSSRTIRMAGGLSLAHLDGLILRRAPDGWHAIWRVGGTEHQFWLPQGAIDAAAFYAAILPMDEFMELRAHAARRLWRCLTSRSPGPDIRAMPAQLRQWHLLSLRALDARLHGESYRAVAEVLLGFRGERKISRLIRARTRHVVLLPTASG